MMHDLLNYTSQTYCWPEIMIDTSYKYIVDLKSFIYEKF